MGQGNARFVLFGPSLLLLSLSSPLDAATVTAASCSDAAVQIAVSSATSGDTVFVPAGNCTWNSQLNISKGIILRGTGIGSTVINSGINDRYGYLINYSPANPSLNEPFELSGFTLNGNYTSGILSIASNSGTIAITKIQAHDNRFINADSRAVSMPGLEFGVFYSNQFQDNYIAISALFAEMAGWNYPLTPGGAGYPYFEDNTFVQTVARGGFITETGRGGRLVFRRNTISGYGGAGGEVWDAHGVTGAYPTDTGQVSSEYYNNTVNLSAPSRVFFHRGGRAIVFNNTVTGSGGNMQLTEYQAWSYCTSAGYPKPQQVNNSYFFNNVSGGSALTPGLYCASGSCSSCGQYDGAYIQLNRDYWLAASGPDAGKPATCPAGARYGATDTGKIYACNTSNVWTNIYTPFTYPHPLRGGGTGPAKYVRKGATGNGSGGDWTNAYAELNQVSYSGLSGGTVYIAAGSYTTGLPGVNIANVAIRRATVASHGADAGWSSAFDNQVTVTPNSGANFLVIGSAADGFVLDGMGYSPWKFRVAGVRGYNGMLRNDGADNVVIRGMEFDGMGESTPYGGPEDGLRWMGGANDIIEHNFIHDYRQAGGAHNDGVQGPSCTNITFRSNVFKNNGMSVFLGDYDWGNQYCNGISIHHNVFYNDPNGGSYNTIVFKGTNQNGSYANKIENNVFNLRGQGTVFYLADSPAPGCCNNLSNGYFRNNIIYSSPVGNVAFYSHAYNLYYNSSGPSETGGITGNPLFVDINNNDYALQATSPAINKGTNLGYTEDIIGTPISGAPDMGAYEYAGSSPDPTPPAAPKRLRLR